MFQKYETKIFNHGRNTICFRYKCSTEVLLMNVKTLFRCKKKMDDFFVIRVRMKHG